MRMHVAIFTRELRSADEIVGRSTIAPPRAMRGLLMTKPVLVQPQPKAGGKPLRPRSPSKASPYSYSNVAQDRHWGMTVKVTSQSEVRERIEGERVVTA